MVFVIGGVSTRAMTKEDQVLPFKKNTRFRIPTIILKTGNFKEYSRMLLVNTGKFTAIWMPQTVIKMKYQSRECIVFPRQVS